MKIIAVEEHISKSNIDTPEHIRKHLNDMDEAGIDVQVLSCRVTPDDSVDTVKHVNEALAGIVEKYPQRFAGFASVPYWEPDAVSTEFERAVKNLGLKGTLLFAQEYLDDRKYWPLFETAEKLDMPVYLHPEYPPLEMIKPYLSYPGLDGAMLGFAAHESLQAMRLILSGIFDEYPRLKIILGHLGEALPFWLWRLDSRFLNEIERNPQSKIFYENLKKTPSQYLKNNFYVTTSGMFWHPAIQFVSSVLGVDRVLFGTDYPQEDIDAATKAITTVPLSNTDKEKICHLNAEELLKL